jgi:hypothetical protein
MNPSTLPTEPKTDTQTQGFIPNGATQADWVASLNTDWEALTPDKKSEEWEKNRKKMEQERRDYYRAMRTNNLHHNRKPGI